MIDREWDDAVATGHKRWEGKEMKAKAVKNGEPEAMHTAKSGATSSHLALRYDLIPREFMEVLARRFTDGAAKHGIYAYRKGLRDNEFIADRLNHIFEHLHRLFQPAPDGEEDSFTDNLGAIGWGIAFLAEVAADPIGAKILIELRRR